MGEFLGKATKEDRQYFVWNGDEMAFTGFYYGEAYNAWQQEITKEFNY